MMVRLGLVSPIFFNYLTLFHRRNKFRRPVVARECPSLGLRQGVEAIYNGLPVSLVSCAIPSLTEDESTISLKATARLETAQRTTILATVYARLYYGNY